MSPIPPDGCIRARRQLSLRLDGELSEIEGLALQAHLEGCAACRAVGSELEAMTDALRAVPPAVLTSSLRLPQRPDVRTRAVRAVSAAAAMAAVAVSGLVGLHLSTSQAPGADLRTARERIALKERQLQQIDAIGRVLTQTSPGVEAARQTTVVDNAGDRMLEPFSSERTATSDEGR